jgi:hypothetical protein
MGKSTGPRTPRGKARSSQNAAKHWIESGRILPEEQQDAAILRNGLTEDFKPQGLIEHEVIDDLTLNRLIKRRIDMAFTREFSKATIEKAIRLLENDERSGIQYWLRAAGAGGRYWAQREQSERLRPELCITALESLKRRIGECGPQPENLAALRRIYGDQPTELAAITMYELIPVAEKQTEQDQKAETADEKELKKSILDTLEAEIELQKNRQELAKGIFAIESSSDLQEPPRPALETLLRYRAANTREFKDLLDSLERIRHLRQSSG